MKLKRILIKYKLVLYIIFIVPVIAVPMIKHFPIIKDFAQIAPAQTADISNLPSDTLPEPSLYSCDPGSGVQQCTYKSNPYSANCYSSMASVSPYNCMNNGDPNSPAAKNGFNWVGGKAQFPSGTHSYIYNSCSCPSAYADVGSGGSCGACTINPYIESYTGGGTTWDVNNMIKDWKTGGQCGVSQLDVGGFWGVHSNFVKICTPSNITMANPAPTGNATNITVTDVFTIDFATGVLGGDKTTATGDSLPNYMDVTLSDTQGQNVTGTMSGKNLNISSVAISKTVNHIDCTSWTNGTCIGNPFRGGTSTFVVKVNNAPVIDTCTLTITTFAKGTVSSGLSTVNGNTQTKTFNCGTPPTPTKKQNVTFTGYGYCLKPGGGKVGVYDVSSSAVKVSENGASNSGTDALPPGFFNYSIKLLFPTNTVDIKYTPSSGMLQSNVMPDWTAGGSWTKCGTTGNGSAILCLNNVPPTQTVNDIIYNGADNTSKAIGLTGSALKNLAGWLINYNFTHITQVDQYNYVVKDPNGKTVAQGVFTCSASPCHASVQLNCPDTIGNYDTTITPSPSSGSCDAYSPAIYTAAINSLTASCPGYKCLQDPGNSCTVGYACEPCTQGQPGCIYVGKTAQADCLTACLTPKTPSVLEFSPLIIHGGISADHVYLDRDLGQTGNLCDAAETIFFTDKYKNIFQTINSSFLSNFKELGF